jgi:hypothetical protein
MNLSMAQIHWKREKLTCTEDDITKSAFDTKAGVKECLKEWAIHNNKPVGN